MTRATATDENTTLLIYGGSFDPPHRAHIDLPLAAGRAVGAEVMFVPAGSPPHKPGSSITPAEHRLAMLRLALAGRAGCSISTIELDRPGPSYTVDTLVCLRRQLPPRTKLRLLIGSDMALCFHQWRDPHRIIQIAEPLVMLRPPVADAGSLLDQLPADFGPDDKRRWVDRIVPVPWMDVSSSDLRNRLARGDYDHPAVRSNLDRSVIDYIRRHRLYTSV
jgi:nicotinate-nucleotide adenylyltransferase